MHAIHVYLNFDGNCREAMTFYKDCLGGELFTMPFSQAPVDSPESAKDRLMHARLGIGSTMLMGSDCLPGTPLTQGNNFSVSLHCDSPEEIEKLFQAFSRSGKVIMPLQDAFWGARFGMLRDQFGINWMFSHEKPKAGE